MNVLFLSQIIPYPPHGGVLQRGFNLIRELHRHGDVHLLAFCHPDALPTPETLEESRAVLSKYCRTLEYFTLWPKANRLSKFVAFGLGALWPGPFSVLAHRSAAFRRKMREVLRTQKIDVIHFDTAALAQYDESSSPLPKIVTHHNIESELMERRAKVEQGAAAAWYLRRQARLLREYEAKISPRFDVNVMMSQIDAQKLRQLAPTVRTEIVPNGVDVEYFTPRRGDEEPAVIYTGGMNMFANRDAVLHFIEDMWPAIKRAVPETVFYVIGQDPPRELSRIAEQDSSIKVLGYVPDIRPYVAKAAVYIVPLRVGGGTRLKVVDAMAQGKAIVSTSVGCEGIEVEDGQNISIADESVDFAARVISLLRDPTARHRLGDAARRRAADRYAWRTVGEKLVAAYRDAEGISQERAKARQT